MAKRELFTSKMMTLYEPYNGILQDTVDNKANYDASIPEYKHHREAVRTYEMSKQMESIDKELCDALYATAIWYAYSHLVVDTPQFVTTDAKGREVLDYNALSNYLIRKYCIVTTNNIAYIYIDDRYYEDQGRIAKDLVKLLKESTYSDNKKVEHIIRDIIYRIKKETSKFTGFPFNQKAQYLIPVKNGVIVRKSLNILLPKSPVWGFTYSLPVVFDPTAIGKPIEDFLKEIVDGDDYQLLVQIPAQALMQNEHYQQAYLLTGDGANGKSTYISLIRELVDVNSTTSVSLQEIVDDRFKAAELQGKLMNLYPDLPKAALKTTGKFKALTGGDRITVEKKFAPPFQLTNKAVFVFSANELPPVDDSTFAFWRRWAIIEFPRKFKVDPNYVKRLLTKKNQSGFLNMVIKQMDEIERNGIKRSERVERAMEIWKSRSNSTYAFAMEILDFTKVKANYIPKDGLYSHYIEWCKQNDTSPDTKHKFTSEIEKMGSMVELITVDRNRIRAFTGVKRKGEGAPVKEPEKKEIDAKLEKFDEEPPGPEVEENVTVDDE